MQNRRDQLQAYRFMVRRAVAALVTGEPDVPENPMRRLTVITLAGLMVAVLVGAGFGILGLLRPGPSDSWKKDGAIVVDPQGTRYVYLKDKLHPTLNYTSAVLAVSPMTPSVVRVSEKSIADVDRGDPIGLADLPQTLPSKGSDLVRGPWTLCSLTVTDTDNKSALTVTLQVGGTSSAVHTPTPSSVLVSAGGIDYLLAGNWRFTLPKHDRGSIEANLGLINAVPVSTDFVAGIPDGGPLQAPRLPREGHAPDKAVSVGGYSLRVGDLVAVGSTTYAVTRDGFAGLSPLQQALFKADKTRRSLTAPKLDPSPAAQLPNANRNLPDAMPPPAAGAAAHFGVCDVWDAGTKTWSIAVPPAPDRAPLPNAAPTDLADGRADAVTVPNDRAALIRSDQDVNGVSIVAPMTTQPYGRRFAVSSNDVLTAFGYAGITPVAVPASLVLVLPTGPALDPDQVRSSGHV